MLYARRCTIASGNDAIGEAKNSSLVRRAAKSYRRERLSSCVHALKPIRRDDVIRRRPCIRREGCTAVLPDTLLT